MRLTIFLIMIAVTGAAEAAEPIAGRWITDDGKAIVTIRQCGAVTCGHITRILAPMPNGPPNDELERAAAPAIRVDAGRIVAERTG